MATRKASRGRFAASTRGDAEPRASAQTSPRVYEGMLAVGAQDRFVVVASRFNHFIVDRLVDGAVDAILRHGGRPDQIDLIRVPGSWEMPALVARIARRHDPPGQPRGAGGRGLAVIAVGAVIRGATPHFDYVAGEVAKGLAAVAVQTGVTVTFGIITSDTIEQAIERAGTKAGNKGWDAAVSAIEMLSLETALDRAGL
jgi:6,7-dimethyl-8-ribityllumazine synthase